LLGELPKLLLIKSMADLKDNVSFKYVAKQNNLSTTLVRNNFLKATEKQHYHYELYFPEVIAIDEFKANTEHGKYACIITDPINKKTIDILPSRKKKEILKYLTFLNHKNKRYGEKPK